MSKTIIYIAKNDKLGSDIVWQRKTGRQLLQVGMREQLGDDKFVPNVKKQESGKPYLLNSVKYFNISHSQQFVVCAISDNEVGIDIQFHKKDDIENVARRMMSVIEWQEFQMTVNKSKYFYDLWAQKESYLKYTGEGLSVDMRLLTIDACVQEVEVDEKYSCMVCTHKASEIKYVGESFGVNALTDGTDDGSN